MTTNFELCDINNKLSDFGSNIRDEFNKCVQKNEMCAFEQHVDEKFEDSRNDSNQKNDDLKYSAIESDQYINNNVETLKNETNENFWRASNHVTNLENRTNNLENQNIININNIEEISQKIMNDQNEKLNHQIFQKKVEDDFIKINKKIDPNGIIDKIKEEIIQIVQPLQNNQIQLQKTIQDVKIDNEEMCDALNKTIEVKTEQCFIELDQKCTKNTEDLKLFESNYNY